MKKCNLENNQQVCCCYCKYNEECNVSCFTNGNFNCEDGHCDLAYLEFERKIKVQVEDK